MTGGEAEICIAKSFQITHVFFFFVLYLFWINVLKIAIEISDFLMS